MKIIDLSKEQRRARKEIVDWVGSNNEKETHYTLGGVAGSGKTTVIADTRKRIKKFMPEKSVAFCCYTGAAANVLQNKLRSKESVFPSDYCGTLHRLMYKPIVENEKIIDWLSVDEIEHDLVIIDEGSMVPHKIWNDLLCYNVPIVVVGDHCQLPPVETSPYNKGFNLMNEPDFKLETIHRQKEGDPIIRLSRMALDDGHIPIKRYGPTVRKFRRGKEETKDFLNSRYSSFRGLDMVIALSNRTRVQLNQTIRRNVGIEGSQPKPGDRVICLHNNYNSQHCTIYNGMRGRILEIKDAGEHWYDAKVKMDHEKDLYVGTMSKYFFNNEKREIPDSIKIGRDRIGDQFDYGYAMTCHKAQGSEANRVIIHEEYANIFKEWNRWLYTAITRARKELYIISEY